MVNELKVKEKMPTSGSVKKVSNICFDSEIQLLTQILLNQGITRNIRTDFF